MLKTKAIPLELKSLKEDGTFSGYGSVFNVRDFGGDIVMPGAFAKSLKEWDASGMVVPVLWQHRSGEPIGDWANLKEDATGLLGDASLWVDDAPYAKIAHKGMKTKTITGLSIGYEIVIEEFDKKKNALLLHEVKLREISVVTNPMNDYARVEAVKSIEGILKSGGVPSLKEFEDFLREAGFSKTQASYVAGNGLRKLLLQCETDSANSKTSQLLNNFQL